MNVAEFQGSREHAGVCSREKIMSKFIRAAYAGVAMVGFSAVGFGIAGPLGLALGPGVVAGVKWNQMAGQRT